MEGAKTKSLFLREDSSLGYSFIMGFEYPWQALEHIGTFILERAKELPKDKYEKIKEDVWAAKSAKIADSAYISGPTIIDENAEIRHCAFIRGNAVVGKGCVVGNSTELKNVILFDGVQVPHYNYVGDSVLGYGSHMGAGAITSNVKGDKSVVCVHQNSEIIDTGLRKFGAIIGDCVEIGCGCVLNPGTVIGASTRVYPLCSVRGVIGRDVIYKTGGNIVGRRD